MFNSRTVQTLADGYRALSEQQMKYQEATMERQEKNLWRIVDAIREAHKDTLVEVRKMLYSTVVSQAAQADPSVSHILASGAASQMVYGDTPEPLNESDPAIEALSTFPNDMDNFDAPMLGEIPSEGSDGTVGLPTPLDTST
jgi:hypothetical protein